MLTHKLTSHPAALRPIGPPVLHNTASFLRFPVKSPTLTSDLQSVTCAAAARSPPACSYMAVMNLHTSFMSTCDLRVPVGGS